MSTGADERMDAGALVMARVGRLQALSAQLAEAATPAQIAAVAVAHAARVRQARTAGFSVVADDGTLVALAVSNPGPERLARDRVVAADAPLPSSDVLRHAEPLFLPDRAAVDAYEGLRDDPDRSPRVSCLPLVVDGFVLGVLSITYDVPAPFSLEEREFLLAIAGVCGHALARARAYESERAARQRLERLVAQALRVQEVSERLSRPLPPDQIAELATRESAGALGGERAGLWIVDGGVARLQGAFGFTDAVHRMLARVGLDDPMPIAEAMRSGLPVYVESFAAMDERFPLFAPKVRAIDEKRSLNLACLPLAADDRVLGVLAVVFSDERRLDADERTFLLVIARQFAQALERWRLYVEIRDAAVRAELLAASTAALARATSAGEVFEVLSDSARALDADRASLWLVGAAGELQLAADWRARDDRAAADREPDVYDARLLESLRRKRALYVESGVDTGATVPLAVAGAPLGVLALRFVRARLFAAADRVLIENIAAQSAHALERARLHQAEQAARSDAEEANRAKDEFLAMLGHELRNPLAPILTALQLMQLREGSLGREEKVIDRQVRYLLRLVDDLLDVSRITRGKVELARAAVDIADVVARAVEMAGPANEQKRHRLEVEVPRGLCVDGDEQRLAQVVANLLTNAARYTPPQGHILVRGERVDGQVMIRVRDDGVGIPAHLLPRVFDLFVQGHRGVDRAEGGLGLGLTLVRRFVEMHGGRVHAESEGHNRGSEFVVELPALARTEAVVSPVVPVSAVERTVPRTRVLLVDDNVDAVELMAEALREAGHEVEVAHDGAGALVAVERFRPEVAVLDLGLPVMDGVELAGRLRARPELSAMRLVALTGYGQPHDRRRTAAAGFHHHLVKPTSVEELLGVIAPST
ncbi:MAG: Chemotaxis protein methyltransferase CheR [Myxococcales bacterium]|nr:Chemotaxis protein methyltransferase CheR [Myxococcales bacterium]